MTLLLIVVFSVLGSIGSALLASLLFLRRGEFSAPVKTVILSYATGTLLGAALLGMVPHALAHLPARTVLATVLAGIVGFFILEKLLVWRHCHEPDCQVHARAGLLILMGDAVHNLIDGVAIALAFMQSVPLGVATSLAVIAHEVPQEIGDIMILVHSGYSRTRAIVLNSLASLTTLVGALATCWMGERIAVLSPYALAVSAASFLYIALADLTPDHRAQTRLRDTLLQLGGMAAGLTTIVFVQMVRH